jgi:plasmid stability protein
MPKMIQIRHVPDAVHRKLKARAATKGMSLSDYLMLEISELAKLPTMEDWLDEIATREPVELREPSAITIRKMRESR